LIDLHTHLLPDWDDGPGDWEEAFNMAKVAQEDGTTKIGITPHLFRLTRYGDDFGLLEERMAGLKGRASRFQVQLYRGAEVYIREDIVANLKRHNLTVNGSCYFFVEFPADGMIAGGRDLFYKIMLEGYIPIISHPERNMVFAQRPELLFELVSMGALAQVTAKSILGEFGHKTKETAELFLKNNLVHLIASDAHDSLWRPPLLSRAVEKAEKIVGKEKARAMVTAVPQAILDNEQVPEYDRPVHPTKRHKWLNIF